MCKQFHTWMCSLNQEYRERASALRLRKIFSTASVQCRFLDPEPCLADLSQGVSLGARLGLGSVCDCCFCAFPLETRSLLAPSPGVSVTLAPVLFLAGLSPGSSSAPFPIPLLPGAARGRVRGARSDGEPRCQPPCPAPRWSGSSAAFPRCPSRMPRGCGGRAGGAEPELAARWRQVRRLSCRAGAASAPSIDDAVSTGVSRGWQLRGWEAAGPPPPVSPREGPASRSFSRSAQPSALCLLLCFICFVAYLFPGLDLSPPAGEEGTTHPQASLAGTHAATGEMRRRG